MQGIIQEMDLLQEKIFGDYQIECSKDIISISEKIQSLAIHLDEERQKYLLELLKHKLIALENKDHLLLADILEYELKPFLKKL